MRSSTSGTFNHTFYRHRSRPHLLLVAILVSSWLTLAPSRTASVAADGPTQPINAIKVVEGRDTSCGDGWTKINKDLNEGAAGTPYFYLCYSRGSTNPLTHLYPIVGQSSGISCDSGDTKYPAVPGRVRRRLHLRRPGQRLAE